DALRRADQPRVPGLGRASRAAHHLREQLPARRREARMSDDDFFSVVHRQRACREFSERDVPDVLVAQVLDAAVFAPSAENHQPWDFVVVRDANLRARLGDLFKQAWTGGGREVSAPRVPLGWPAKPLGPPRRDPFADHTHRDRYGTAW